MRTNEEIIRAVHARAHELSRRREKARLVLTGGAGTVLTCLLILMISSFGGFQHEVRATGFAGASLLAESAGGYILAAVVAFMAGVIVMVLRQSRVKKEHARKAAESLREEEAETSE